MTLRRSHLSFAFLSFALAAGGCAGASSASGTGGAPAAPAITAELIAEGQTLFASAGRCGVCHGPTGAGGRSGPNLTDDTWLWVDTSGDVHAQLFRIIKEGIPEPRQAQIGMPAMGGGNLTDQQIHAIAAYVASL
jgi:mono/diheme cytochrome c family protein